MVLESLEALPLAEALRFSRWSYALVNAGHVLAVALLVGGALPLSLRLLGLWRTVPLSQVTTILGVTAGIGLGLALVTGGLLFATRATEYAANPAFRLKLAFVAIGSASAGLAHARYGRHLSGADGASLRRVGALSCLCWLGALLCGRMIAFVE